MNITAFRLVNVGGKRYQEIIDQMQKLQHSGLDMINGISYIQVHMNIRMYGNTQYILLLYIITILSVIDGLRINIRFCVRICLWAETVG